MMWKIFFLDLIENNYFLGFFLYFRLFVYNFYVQVIFYNI